MFLLQSVAELLNLYKIGKNYIKFTIGSYMDVTETILYDVTHTFLISDRTKVVNLFGICKQINIFNTKKIHPPLWYVNG